ncbi:hypothetical protein V6N12_021509 [Hibiscus sabdariffa]|uniref:Uncharacterized protein n=1 Tax=Hibiscus sabdariffa TaxID=183260 RepID=A0ABR2FRY1_9ROSI
MYVDSYCHDQDGDHAEIYNGVNQDGYPTGAHVSKLYHPRPRRQLAHHPRRQHDEQYHRNDHRSPVCIDHFSLPILFQCPLDFIQGFLGGEGGGE